MLSTRSTLSAAPLTVATYNLEFYVDSPALGVPPKNPEARALIREAIRRLNPDVLHVNYASYGPSSACAARLLRIPVIGRPGPFLAGNPSNRWISAYAANCRAHGDDLLASPLADRVVVTGDLLRLDRLRATRQQIAPLPLKRDGLGGR